MIPQNHTNVKGGTIKNMNNSVANADIRKKAERAGVKFWQIAAKLGVHPCTLTVWLRQEMSAERKAQVKQAIAEIKEENA